MSLVQRTNVSGKDTRFDSISSRSGSSFSRINYLKTKLSVAKITEEEQNLEIFWGFP